MTTQWLHRDADDGWLGYNMEGGTLGINSRTFSAPKFDPQSMTAIAFVTPEQLISIGRDMMGLGEYLCRHGMGARSELAGGDHGTE